MPQMQKSIATISICPQHNGVTLLIGRSFADHDHSGQVLLFGGYGFVTTSWNGRTEFLKRSQLGQKNKESGQVYRFAKQTVVVSEQGVTVRPFIYCLHRSPTDLAGRIHENQTVNQMVR